MLFGGNDAKAEAPVLWPPHAKSWLIEKDSDAGRDWEQEEKGTTEDEMAGWHHRLDGRESEWTPGAGDGQGGLACCDSQGRKEWDMTERLNWNELTWNNPTSQGVQKRKNYLMYSKCSTNNGYSYFNILTDPVKVKVKVLVAQLCPTLCNPMDCSAPGSSVHGILQAGILEWVDILFSRGSSQPGDQIQVSWIAGRLFTIWATRETDSVGFAKLPFVDDKGRSGKAAWSNTDFKS